MAPELRPHGYELSSLLRITATAFPWDPDGWIQPPNEQTTRTPAGRLRADGTQDRALPTQATLNADIVTPAPLFARGSHAADFGLHLTGLTFTGPGYYDILMDTNGQPYPMPHWTPTWSHPPLYVSGSHLRATLQLGAAAGLIGQVVHLRGEGGGYTLWCSNYTVSASLCRLAMAKTPPTMSSGCPPCCTIPRCGLWGRNCSAS